MALYFARGVFRQFQNQQSRFNKDESGSLIIFSLFIFLLILFMAGMAVDTMRHETKRVAMQNTLDSAILAASSLTQDMDAEALVKEHVAKAGLNPDDVTVTSTEGLAANGEDLVSRRVAATSTIDTNTMFMSMMGIDELEGHIAGAAEEGVQNIEISMIVDISGSMGGNSRLVNLKVAAQEFIDHVLAVGPNAQRTSISIIPYNATVVAGSELLSRLNAGGAMVQIANPPPYSGALTEYPTQHNNSTCVRFEDAEFNERAIGPTTPLNRVSHFDEGQNSFNAPTMNGRWCNENRAEIMVHETDPDVLKQHIVNLTSGGWTGIDNGMKWGVALLDPAIAPVIDDMVDDGVLIEDVRGRPGNYDADKTMKVIVLMTDGANTVQRDLKQEYKRGPSRVWYADSRTSGWDATLGRNLNWYDGYYVEMPNNVGGQRWWVPENPGNRSDGYYVPVGQLPGDAVQRTYQELHERFAEEDIARFFFRDADNTAYSDHTDGVEQTEGYASIDSRLEDICDAAKVGGRIEVFAIGFEAPQAGLDAMRNCASTISHYYDVQGTEISQAFDSIAGQISMLRLKE
ncbi:MAG: pilus assembly protein TadG-related protein [Boseongicola sp.]